MASFGYLELTRECNQHCRFCSSPKTKKARTLSFKEGKRVIDGYIRNKMYGVILTGGEPTISLDLPKYLRYCQSKKSIEYTVISNGQKLADFNFLKSLKKAGLYKINISLYSCRPEIQGFLAEKKDSFYCIKKALENLGKLGGIIVNINTVINHYNADHLSETVKWVVKNFPFVRHFVWNNLDPWRNRAERENPDTIPKFNEFELELHKAMEFLKKTGRTFRVERVPLCYMTGFEEYSADTRRIVKEEKRWTLFLDSQGLIKTKAQRHDYGQACQYCFLKDICAGVYKINKFYSEKEIHPVFVDRKKILEKIAATPPFKQ